MAKRRGINKSQAIRDYLKEDPRATPKVIKEEMARRGITVTDSLVSLVKYKSGSRRRGRKRRGGRVARSAANSFSGSDLLAVKAIMERMGSVDRVKEALSVVERLS
jgi:hypothetical protein